MEEPLSTSSTPPSAALPPNTASTPRIRERRFPGLDGLRAVAVGVVVLHNTTTLMPGGYVGVILFFVISGFLITSLLDREFSATGGIRLGAFYLRRALRLFPALAEALVLLVLLSWRHAPADEIGKAVGLVAAYAWNWSWVFIPAPQVPGFWGPLWSLSVEEQFYLVWPVALLGLLVLTRTSRRAGALAWAVLALAVAGTAWRCWLWAYGASGSRVYVGTDTRGDALLLGAALALVMARRAGLRRAFAAAHAWLLPAGLLFLALCFLLPAPDLEAPATWQLGPGMVVPTLVGVVLVGLAVTADPGTQGARLLASRPFVWLGDRSYAVYLFHLPISVTLSGSLEGKVAAYALTLGLAELSHRFVEAPVRRRVPAWARQR